MRRLVSGVVALSVVAGCAYQRHTTNLTPIPPGRIEASAMPRDMYTLRINTGALPEQKMSGLAWDEDGTGPDPFVRVHIDNRLVWQSDVFEDSTHPEWNAVLPENVIVKADSTLRIEVLDWDTAVSFDPVARIDRNGLPTNALPDAIARVQLDARTTLTILVTAPRAYKGVGLKVELRPDALKVLAVEEYSPAARAGIQVGEHIVGVGPWRVSEMGDQQAASQLTLSAERGEKLKVTDAQGLNEREVTLDNGYVWLVL